MAGQAITYDNMGGGSNLFGAFASGTLTSDDTTPAAVNIKCGFRPRGIIFIITTGTNKKIEWWYGMPGTAPYLETKDNGAGTADLTYSATGGPTYYDGSAGVVGVGVNQQDEEDGFTWPAALQTAGDVGLWVAFR